MPNFKVTMTRPAYEYAEVTIWASDAEAAGLSALDTADDVDWQGGDRLPDDAPTVIAVELETEE